MMMATFGPCSLGSSSTLGGATGSIGDASGGSSKQQPPLASPANGLLFGGALGGDGIAIRDTPSWAFS
jgi:hypothetical protein